MTPKFLPSQWFGKKSDTSRRSKRPQRLAAVTPRSLLIELLEDRSVPAVVNWIGAVDENWNNAANWYNTSTMTSVVPADGDDLVFDEANLTGNQVATGLVNNLNSLTFVGNLNLQAGSFTITSGNSIGVLTGVTVNDSGDDTLGIGIFGAGQIDKFGGSNLTLSGNSAFTGNVNVYGGSLTVAGDNALGSTVGVTIVGDGNSLIFQDVDYTAAETVNLGSSTIGATGESRFAGDILMGGPLVSFDVAADSRLKLTGVISEDTSGLGFSVDGAGLLILDAANTFTGDVNVNSGRLRVTENDALGTIDGVTNVAAGAALDFSNVDYTTLESVIVSGGIIASTYGDSDFDGTIELLSADATIDINDCADLHLNGEISGSFGFTKIGCGAVGLAFANTFTGAITINEGVVEVLADGALGTVDGGTTVGYDGVLYFEAVDYTLLEEITLDGGILAEDDFASFGGDILLTDDSAIDADDGFEIYGNISGPFGITLIGCGYVFLDGANTYTGDTYVDSGVLAGSGSLTSDIYVGCEGALLPGCECEPGILTTTGSTTFEDYAYFVIEIFGAIPGDEHGQLVTNGLTLDGADLAVLSLFDGPDGTEIIIVSNTSGSAVNGTFYGLEEGDYIESLGAVYQISYVGGDGNDVSLTIVTVAYFRTTVGIYNPQNATWSLRNENNNSGPPTFTFQYGFSGVIAVTGDWNGDGQDTIGVYNPTTATWYLRNSNSAGSPDYVFSYGFTSGIPVIGDWDGDGTDTIGIYDPNTGIWRLRNSNSAGSPDEVFAFGFGSNPVVGNWDGVDGDGIGVYDANTATWYLRNTPSSGSADVGIFAYGFSNVKPVTGDWNFDGIDGIGVFSKSTATWYLRDTPNAGSPNAGVFTYGATTSQVVTGSWNPELCGCLTAAGGAASGVSVADADLDAIVAEALSRWGASDLANGLSFYIADLSGNAIAQANGRSIVIDRDAAGYGWFIDSTPEDDSEFADGEGPAGMDLLTAVMHELGHLFGLDHTDSDEDLMARTLRSGVRQEPSTVEIDAVLASDTFDSIWA